MLETSDVGRVFLVLFELGLHGVEIDLSLLVVDPPRDFLVFGIERIEV